MHERHPQRLFPTLRRCSPMGPLSWSRAGDLHPGNRTGLLPSGSRRRGRSAGSRWSLVVDAFAAQSWRRPSECAEAPLEAGLSHRPLLRAPFPWFGGKSRVAPQVWQRFGRIRNLVVPFCGSMAIELGCPKDWWAHMIVTVNDIDAYVANFWRALAAGAGGEVASHADWPVNEADLHARHRWLVETSRERVEKCLTDPEYFDAKVAGWWVWGQCLWIGSGWCSRPEWTGRFKLSAKPGSGVLREGYGGATSRGIQRPHLGSDGQGQGITRLSGRRSPAVAAGTASTLQGSEPRGGPSDLSSSTAKAGAAFSGCPTLTPAASTPTCRHSAIVFAAYGCALGTSSDCSGPR